MYLIVDEYGEDCQTASLDEDTKQGYADGTLGIFRFNTTTNSFEKFEERPDTWSAVKPQ